MRRDETLSRTRAKGFRKTLTRSEVILWAALRRGATGWRFRRQHPIGPYIADFACIQARLVVEVDGATHSSPQELAHDRRRTAYLGGQAWRVLRVSSMDVYEDCDAVVRFVCGALGAPPPV